MAISRRVNTNNEGKVEFPLTPEKEEPVVKEDNRQLIKSPKTNKESDLDIISHIDKCLKDGTCFYHILSTHTLVLKIVPKVSEHYKSKGFNVEISSTPTGYLLKIKRA